MKQRIGFLIMVVSTLAFALEARADDWPGFLGPDRTSKSREVGLLAAWGKEGPLRLWEREVGAGFSGPVVVGNRLILFHRVANEEVIESMNATDGSSQWKFSYPTAYVDDFGFDEGPRSTPLVSAGRVYALGAEGTFSCVRLDTGTRVWQRQLNREYQVPKGYFGVGTSPLIEGDLLLLNIGGPKAGIVALNRSTGQEVWKATDHAASYSSPVAATIGGTRRVIFFTREGVVSLDPRNGSIQYSKHFRARINASVNAATPVIAGNEVFFSACYGVGALLLRFNRDQVEEVWHSDNALSCHYNTSIEYGGYLYGIDGRQEEGARLRCIELKTGRVMWTKEGTGCASMILADEELILLTEGGELVLVKARPDAYMETARAAVLTSPCRSPIALSAGRLYGRDTKKLVCWNLKK